MDFEGMKFPQYRKYSNNRNFFKISNLDFFEELQVIGKRVIRREKPVRIMPDRQVVADLLSCYEGMAEVISEEEYESVFSRVKD